MNEDPKQPDDLKFAALMAHQLKAPVSAVRTLLKTLADGLAGPLTDAQKDTLNRAILRCDQSAEATQRMLTIARVMQQPKVADEITDLAALARQSELDYQGLAREHDIRFSVYIDTDFAEARAQQATAAEALNALLDNAFKYTPDRGHVRVTVSADAETSTVSLSVADSGVGISDKDRDKIFTPFFRTAAVRASARPGSGLGLSFVKAVVEAGGGSVDLGKAALGGAKITLTLPAAASKVSHPADAPKQRPMKVVIIGGVTAGTKAAAKIIRMSPNAEVTVIEKGQFMSYAGCGLPYYISGIVKDQRELMSTPLGVVRDPVFFQNVKNVRVMSQTEAMEIDCKQKRVRICDIARQRENWLDYDKLVLATGAAPVMPDIPGLDLGNVFTLHGMRDAEGIKMVLAETKAHDVVIVGGGLLGVEATEALTKKGGRVTIIEQKSQILNIFDEEIARLVNRHMQSNGVKVLTETSVLRLGGDDGVVRRVVTDRGPLPADMVIVSTGVRPASELAATASLEIGSTGAIKVDQRMQTSDPDIFAAGDCVESIDLLTGQPCYIPMGSTANKQARVAAINLCGGEDTFPGVLGSTVCKVFDYCAARTGLTEAAVRNLGYDCVSALAPAPDRAHYMPDARELLLKLVVDCKTSRVLGAQATGSGQGDKRIDIVATAITGGLTVDQLANLDLCYAPPYSPAMDNIITAANIARNKLTGYMVGVSPVEVRRMLADGVDFMLLDVSTPGEHERRRLPGSVPIPLGSLRGRLDELPRDKEIVTFCAISLRGYEAAIILKAAGFDKVRVLDGGIAMWPYDKIYG